MEKPLIIAHRGAHQTAPENTLAAFEAAIDCRADMIELDVRKSLDGFFITYHDESIQNNMINRIPLRDILALGLERGIKIPLFEEVLELTRDRIKLDIEIKETGDEPEILKMTLNYFKKEEFLITSFLETTLNRIKKVDPRIQTGLIVGEEGFRNPLKTRIFELFPFQRCRKSGIDIILPHWKLLRYGFLRRARKFNIPVIVWTLNSRRKIRKLLGDRHIRGIITDKPELAVSIAGNIR